MSMPCSFRQTQSLRQKKPGGFPSSHVGCSGFYTEMINWLSSAVMFQLLWWHWQHKHLSIGQPDGEEVFLWESTLWMSNSSSSPPAEAPGKSTGWSVLHTRSCYAALSVALFPQPRPASGRCAHSAACLFSLEVVGPADVPVSVFSFSSLQFCYKIGTVRCYCPSDFQRENSSQPSFCLRGSCSPPPSGHRCNLLGERVPSFFHLLLHFRVPFFTAWWLHSCFVLFLILGFSASSKPIAAWLTEQFGHTCLFHPTTALSPACLLPSFWKW